MKGSSGVWRLLTLHGGPGKQASWGRCLVIGNERHSSVGSHLVLGTAAQPEFFYMQGN